MFDYELQRFEQLGREVTGVSTSGDPPLVITNERDQRRFTFNLDWNKPQERAIGQRLKHAKRGRNMVGVIRDAVRLYFDLSSGRVDVLTELFPGIVAAIRAQVEQPSPIISSQNLTGKTAPRPPVVTPDDDSALITITKAAPGGTASAKSFLNSAFNLQG